MYKKYLDSIIEEFTSGDYYKEVYLAKQEYFEKAGIVYEDDPAYEERMCIFLDWYLFDRDLPGVDLPPIKFFYRKNKDGFTDEEMNIYLNFCSTVHSMFRISRLTFFKKDLVITDLFSKKNYTVKNVELKSGFTQGDIFEARLIPFGGHYEFSKGFCFHPIEVGSFILGEIQKVKYQDKEQKTKLILQLADMKLKHLRFQHIDIKHIYSFASRI